MLEVNVKSLCLLYRKSLCKTGSESEIREEINKKR